MNTESEIRVKLLTSTQGNEVEKHIYQVGIMQVEVIARGPSGCGKTISLSAIEHALKVVWEE